MQRSGELDPRTVALLPRDPGSVRRPAPEFGEHTEEILIEMLGHSSEHIAALKTAM